MSNTNTEVLTTAYEKLQGAITQSNTVLPKLEEAVKNADLSNYAKASDLEEKANKSDVNTANARIDSFTSLASGSTTGDAELIDARINSDGLIFENTGGNIRELGSALNKILQYYMLMSKNIIGTIFVTGAIKNGTGVLDADNYPTWESTDFIKVKPSAKYTLSRSGVSTLISSGAFYDASKNFISGFSSVSTVEALSNAHFLRLSISNTTYPLSTSQYQLEEGEIATEYHTVNYCEPLITKPYDGYEIILPSKIYCVVGKEMNIYYSNILYGLNSEKVQKISIDETPDSKLGSNTKKYLNRVKWLPEEQYSLEKNFYCYPYNLVENISKSTKMISIPQNTGNANLTCLIIGDSKIAREKVVDEFVKNFNNDNINISLIGTKQTKAGNHHEGYSGMTAQWFCGSESPFYNSTTSKFDFSNYMSTNNYTNVDYVFINLGTNDTIYSAETFISYLETMITSIHEFDSNIKIMLGMAESIYLGEQNEFSKVKTMLEQKKALINNFDGKETDNIFLVPLYLNQDSYEDFAFGEIAMSVRDGVEGTGKTVRKCLDYVHQSDVGYGKCADVMYYTLKGVNLYY